jgi:hypothetical protein
MSASQLWSLRYCGGFLSENDIRISRPEGSGSEPITALLLRSLDTLAANSDAAEA